MFRLGRARQLFEKTYGSSPPPTSPWPFHRELLQEIEGLAGETEEYEYQLQILDFHDALYEPHLAAEHAWPLLRLGKFDEARKVARTAIASSDRIQQSIGRNALCAIEGEARERKPYFEACLAALDNAKKNAEKGIVPVVHQYNAALAAYSVVRLDEVERLAKEGSGSKPISIANPWRLLTRLYTDGGRAAEAIAAAKQMQSWRSHQAASLRDQDRAETDAALSSLLLVAGESEAAQRLIERAIERPDRRGLVSSKPDQALGAHALLRRSIARTRAEQVSERASWSGTSGRPKTTVQVLGMRIGSWPDDERIVSILGHRERLDSTFRMYLSGGLEPVPSWLVGDLVEVLGPGVVGVAVARARVEEKDFAPLAPYFDALEAEVALARGDHERSMELARKAIEQLPKSEAILAARVAAVGGESARRRGDQKATLALLEQALQKDAGVVRRLGLAIPAHVSGSGDAAVQRAVVLLGRSPRFRDAGWGFVVTVEKDAAGLKACLKTPNGTTLTCVVAAPRVVKEKEPREEPEDWAARLVESFHRDAFAMHVGMTTRDLDSLDGSTTVASQAQREKMQGVLTDVAKDSTEGP
jgi:tetratricopeptide (TPR) repeat protein